MAIDGVVSSGASVTQPDVDWQANSPPATRDCRGAEVHVGDVVRLLAPSQSLFRCLPPGETEHFRTLIGTALTVEDIDGYGCAWVPVECYGGEGCRPSYSVALAPAQMELVNGRSEAHSPAGRRRPAVKISDAPSRST